jgi:hypothetical protein
VTQLVDGNLGIHAIIKKSILPAKQPEAIRHRHRFIEEMAD